MSRGLISTLILLATLSVAGIIATQIYWLDKAFKVQQSQIDLRKEQEVAEAKQFNDRVVIALTNVANEILTINNDPAELFQAVKQVRPNYFTVAINDTVHPYLLENLLRSEFTERNIRENFEYGVYDCFTDSIVYGNYISFSSDSSAEEIQAQAPQFKWEKDGHYFGVFFPNRSIFSINQPKAAVSTWAFSALISLIVFLFFAYAVYVVLRQKRLSEMKTDFVNNMTHELKTPISTIGLSSEMLRNPAILEQPERFRNYVELIHSENERLKLQVDKVLQLAVLERGQTHVKLAAVDIHKVVESTCASLRLVHENDELEITLQLAAENSLVKADPMHLANVVNNLFDNAIKYSPEAKVIRVSSENRKNKLLLRFTDQGIGIPAKSIPYIFDKFYRVHTGNRHDVKGFGLGLFYVAQMMKAFGGKISLESQLGKGSTFTLEFDNFGAR